jgi:hypothetical protein
MNTTNRIRNSLGIVARISVLMMIIAALAGLGRVGSKQEKFAQPERTGVYGLKSR